MEKLRVLKIAPGREPEVVELDHTLQALQEAVSEGAPYTGYIEIVTVEHSNPGVCLMVNEEGKLIGLPPNRYFRGDILAGTIYVMGTHFDELTSLTPDQITKYTQLFSLLF